MASRSVRLCFGAPLEHMTRFYISLSDNYFLSSSCGAWVRSVICNAITKIQVKLYCDQRSVGQFVLVSGELWGPWLQFYLFDNYFLSSLCRVPSPISSMKKVIQPKIKVKSQIHVTVGWNFECYHWEGCLRRTQCNVEFGYQLSICSGAKENHGKSWLSWPVTGPSGCKLTYSQQAGIKYASPNISPYLCCVFLFLFSKRFLFFQKLFFYNYFYVRTVWISTKPLITSAEGINAYMNKYAYICVCDSLIIGKFESLLYFGKIGCYTRFVAHPMTKITFQS
jgi:hypothetical protein